MLCQEEKKVANTIFFFVLEVFMATKRLDRDGAHRKQFERNKKRIYATQTVCGICGKPVDFSYKLLNRRFNTPHNRKLY